MDNILFGVLLFIIVLVIIVITIDGCIIHYRCCRDDHKYRKLNTNTGEYDNDIPEERKRCNGSMTLTIITGKGNHSPHGHPVLKPVVKKYLENNGYTHNVDPQNTGRLFVQLP
ncbi:uncharacterized protein LOC124114851 isoform X1 [Haliotis rufescens]|uniref:uncharacterized protein LOC124114851 isoform X1 n=1 Tax=Haliotis rufescens TaxID=6454 RepID=UPI00201EB6E9|nr:uncharacterized protein LOC124114851 isoform X1 [Haliotis rufescens]